jgi:hypothetical protein
VRHRDGLGRSHGGILWRKIALDPDRDLPSNPSGVGRGGPGRLRRLTCGAPEARMIRKRVCKDFLLYLEERNF